MARFTSENSKLPPDVHALIKELLKMSPRSPREAVLAVSLRAPKEMLNPIADIIASQRISEIDIALALDCSVHEAAMLRVMGYWLSKRQTMSILRLLDDVKPTAETRLEAARRWGGKSYLARAEARFSQTCNGGYPSPRRRSRRKNV